MREVSIAASGNIVDFIVEDKIVLELKATKLSSTIRNETWNIGEFSGKVLKASENCSY
jgi:hypothetical protein